MQVMLRLEEGRAAPFAAAITEARAGVMAGLGAASMESYRRAYPFLLKLHSLRYRADLEKRTWWGCGGGGEPPHLSTSTDTPRRVFFRGGCQVALVAAKQHCCCIDVVRGEAALIGFILCTVSCLSYM